MDFIEISVVFRNNEHSDEDAEIKHEVPDTTASIKQNLSQRVGESRDVLFAEMRDVTGKNRFHLIFQNRLNLAEVISTLVALDSVSPCTGDLIKVFLLLDEICTMKGICRENTVWSPTLEREDPFN